MPINSLEFTTLMQQQLDQHIESAAVTGFMEANAGQVQYNGGRTIKLPTLSTTGLADYDRDKGFNNVGSVTLEFTPYTMTMDRGATFQLDAMDVNETNFIATAAAVMKDFQEKHVIPEIDAYRLSSLAKKAGEATNTEAIALTAANAFGKVREHARAVRDYVGQQVPLVCAITSEAMALIEDSDKYQRTVSIAGTGANDLNLGIRSIDGIQFLIVPSGRMKDKYEYLTGEGAGAAKDRFGFKPASDAKDINWLIFPRSVPIAVSKTDTIRLFTPETYQNAHAWKIDYRKYHDLWVKKSMLKALFACTKA